LIKAGKIVRKWRDKHPDAEFVVVLTTNKGLSLSEKKSDPLLMQLYDKGEELNIELDIWEQSRISRFLDNKPEGHWLRKKYLGIEVELLSEPLFRKLCQKNLSLYYKELFTNLDDLVPRKKLEEIKSDIKIKNPSVEFLVGDSGFGKSTIAYNLLENHIKNGGLGLWICPEYINNSTSIESMICKVLRELYPSLSTDIDTENSLLDIVENDSKFILIVDDINREENSDKIIRKILAWSNRKISRDSELKFRNFPYIFICPIWPNLWYSLSQEFEKTEWIKFDFVEIFDEEEGIYAVRLATKPAGLSITNFMANNLAKKLGYDPFLINLFSQLIKGNRNNEYSLNNLAEDVIERYLKITISEISRYSRDTFDSEYENLLSIIFTNMIRHRRLYPSIHEIKEWLFHDQAFIRGLKDLTLDGRICREKEGKLIFRHDRIHRHLLARSMTILIERNNDIDDIISDPYYADIIGQSILLSPQSKDFLSVLRDKNILALFESYKIFGNSQDKYHQEILTKIKEWVRNFSKTKSAPESFLSDIYWSLIETDSEEVLEITNHLPSNKLILLARLRNGCAISGVQYCDKYDLLGHVTGFSLFDQIIEQARKNHTEKIKFELKSFLRSSESSDNIRKGSLILAGVMKYNGMEGDISICWEHSVDKESVLPAALWAGINCFDEKSIERFDPIFELWSQLKEDKESKFYPHQMRIADFLRLYVLVERKMPTWIVNYFISKSRVYDSLNRPITWILKYIDEPEAIEFIVFENAKYEYADFVTEPWDISLFEYAKKLSKPSLEQLNALWSNESNDTDVRKIAYELWLTGLKKEEIDIIHKIPPESPLFRLSLRKRAEFGDKTVVDDLIPILQTEVHWFDFVYHLWCKDIMNLAGKHLELLKNSIPNEFTCDYSNEESHLFSLMMAIPETDAEKLLRDNWDHLGYSAEFIHAALYVGTPLCLQLAEKSIEKCPVDLNIFSHIIMTFRMKYITTQRYFTKQRAKNLLQYINRFDNSEINDFAEALEIIGVPEWNREYLAKYFNEEDRKRFVPSDEDLIQEVKKYANYKDGLWYVKTLWLEKFDKRHDDNNRLFRVLNRLIESEPTVKNLKIVSECIKLKGSRKDLVLLTKYKIDGASDEVLKIKNDVQYYVYRKNLE
jgi:hypothetical protein